MDLAGKRVGVIGTGATGVQLITEIAKEVGHLTVFQRTANYCAPLRNGPIDPDTQRQIKASYPDIFQWCNETAGSLASIPVLATPTTSVRGTNIVASEDNVVLTGSCYKFVPSL